MFEGLILVILNGIKYIFLAINYVTKWEKEIALPNNEGHSGTPFLKKYIFSQFGIPRAIIINGWSSYFCNHLLASYLKNIM